MTNRPPHADMVEMALAQISKPTVQERLRSRASAITEHCAGRDWTYAAMTLHDLLHDAADRIDLLHRIIDGHEAREAENSEEARARRARDAEWATLPPEEQAARWAAWDADHGPVPF